MLTLGILFGVAGLVTLLWYPVKDAIVAYKVKKIMGDMIIRRDK